MPIIQRPDLVAKVRKAYELAGPDAIASISPELVPVVLVDDLTLRDPGLATIYAIGHGTQSGVAGEYPTVELWNPVGSGVDGYLEAIEFHNPSTGGVFEVRLWTAAPTTAATTVNTQMGAAGTPALYVGIRSDAVPVGAVFHRYRQTSTDQRHFPFPFRITEGIGISVTFELVNNTIRGTFWWSETTRRV